jgi:hypothetical protein
MLRRVALVKTNISEEHVASITKVTKIGELGKTLSVLDELLRTVGSYKGQTS